MLIAFGCTENTLTKIEKKRKQSNEMITCVEKVEVGEELIIIENSMFEVQNVDREFPETTRVFYDHFTEE